MKESIAMNTLIAIAFLIIGARVLQMGYHEKSLEWQLPRAKIVIYSGVIVLTLLDIYKNIGRVNVGLSLAVALSAIFEIISNFLESKSKK